MGRAFKDTQRTLEHLRYSESTRALGQSESTQRALEGTQALGEHSGTRALKALGYSNT